MIGRIAIFFGKALFVLVIASIGWVFAYRFIEVPQTWPMARDAIHGKHVERDWMPLSAIAPAVPRAVIGAEDSHFCSHSGFDLKAIEAAAKRNAAGARLRGGSTISQQTAKNAFLWPGRSYVRKGLEAYFTVLIEAIWGKRRIMEVYLNIAEMGPGIYGVEAAAQHYFNRSAASLSLKQAARIATILPQPIKRDPTKLAHAVRKHARQIERWDRVVRTEGMADCLGLKP